MKKLWFRAKNYGWGWYPVTWQGWLVILLYVGAITAHAFLFSELTKNSGTLADMTWPLVYFVVGIIFLVASLLWICYVTGEKPEWRWGSKTNKK